VTAVADHGPPAAVVLLAGQLGYVLIHLGREHPAGAFPHDLVDQGAGLRRTSPLTTLSMGVPSQPTFAPSVHSVTCRSLGKARPFTQPEADPQVLSIAQL
jgi:hypothetical protein